jgi:hypothetical protein
MTDFARFFAGAAGIVAAAMAGAAAAQQPAAVYRVEDVVVEGRRLDRVAQEFVTEVAFPVNGRGPARWHDGICVGAVNFRREVAQYLVDHVSAVAESLGLRAHDAPCHPMILIIGADDGAAMADELVASRPLVFRPGGSGMHADNSVLRAFRTERRPVRWWHVSAPTHTLTGELAVRLPGQFSQVPDWDETVLGYAPQFRQTFASRLSQPYDDRMKRSFVVVDMTMIEGVALEQLADYIAFVSLAQVNPDVSPSRFESILNLFTDGGVTPNGFSAWDRAYLDGLYDMQTGYVATSAHRRALTRSILEAYEARVPEE